MSGDVAQLVKCLTSKHEELSSGPQHPINLGLVAYALESQSLGRWRKENPRACGIASLAKLVSSRFSQSLDHN